MVTLHTVKELLAKNSVTQPMKYIVGIIFSIQYKLNYNIRHM